MKKATIIGLVSVLFIITAIFITSCRRQTCSTRVVPPPSSLAVAIEENGNMLEDSIKRQIEFYYYQGSSRRNLNLMVEDSLLGEYIQGKGFVVLDYKIYQLLRENGVKNYYIEFPDSTTDTLYLEIEKVGTCQVKKEKCYCNYPIRSIKYNGHDVSEHELSWTYGVPIYILER